LEEKPGFMKLLFISIRDVNRKTSGGEKCTNRNYLSFCDLLGKENVEVVNILDIQETGMLNTAIKRFGFLQGYYVGLSVSIKNRILEKAYGFDYVFIDASYLGILAWHLKKSGYKGKIISFFHNVEVSVMRQKARLNPFHAWKIVSVRYNEKMAVHHSDRIVVLTSRDKEELERIYHTNRAEIIPISLPDEYMPAEHGMTSYPPVFLFVGDNWFPNIHGIRWFIENVLDNADIRMQIAGRNMEHLRDKFAHPKAEFMGFVDDLPKAIAEADYFLSPVFRGGGMKVKICEALMHGKHIIATSEAFEGYEIDPMEVGARCNTAGEFITAIERLGREPRRKFNVKSREYYLRNYSFGATLELFRKLLQ